MLFVQCPHSRWRKRRENGTLGIRKAQVRNGPVMDWKTTLRRDPTPVLLRSAEPAIRVFARRDLADGRPDEVEQLWALAPVQRLIHKQQSDGSWRYPSAGKPFRSTEDYNQIETYRVLRWLVEKYGMTRGHPAIQRAAGFLFAHQTEAGDFRGICGTQYVPYYSAGMMEMLIKAGYEKDPRIERGFRWLLSMRQDDGGWSFPLRTVGMNLGEETFSSETVEPDRAKPFSHLVTGIVLRAFAAHPRFSESREARAAGELLAGRFFHADRYPDRRAPSFWTSFSYPFWFTDLLSSLDSLSRLGFRPDEADVKSGLDWFRQSQRQDGRWVLRIRAMARELEPHSWITLAVSRVFERFCR